MEQVWILNNKAIIHVTFSLFVKEQCCWPLKLADQLAWTQKTWGLFHKTSLPNKSVLFQLVWLILNQINWQ